MSSKSDEELLEIAKKDSVEGFAAFYEFLNGHPLPEHMFRAMENVYKRREEKVVDWDALKRMR